MPLKQPAIESLTQQYEIDYADLRALAMQVVLTRYIGKHITEEERRVKQARMRGEITYESLYPCHRGHYIKSSAQRACRICRNEYRQREYKKNHEKNMAKRSSNTD